ncbi:histidine kinase internal region (plasmid) [Gemmatirosa kalamazoonensis]|uniref:Histidine kinase internal region n=1 Tax=Gemmatirosa kalamazoonensis TaxID=861299 RepID=W0RRJ9_9BACT|nr:histidine kinase [Gemmatirosa kalamazoonensis]AHG92950.1 histidine kinase internal region [Gemmatirosa kalamazoonensis]
MPPFWLLQTGGWIAFSVAMALSRLGMYPLVYMVATKTLLAVLGVVVSLGLRALYRRLLPGEPGVGRTIVVCVVASYVAAAVWTAVYNVVDAPLATAMLGRRIHVDNALELLAGTVYHAFALLAWSVLYLAIKHQARLHAERERALRAEAHLHQARLEALRYQINPHFRFNTLNAISTLVVEGRTDEATVMIARLGEFLRLTLAGEGVPEIPLAEELDFVERYLEIEQVRFGERLRVRVDAAPGLASHRVPALILQPLVENAVKHAVATRETGGSIAVSARRAGDALVLAVEDDGPGLGDGPPVARGIGLANTRDRLRERYGDGAALSLEAPDGGGLRATIRIPLAA